MTASVGGLFHFRLSMRCRLLGPLRQAAFFGPTVANGALRDMAGPAAPHRGSAKFSGEFKRPRSIDHPKIFSGGATDPDPIFWKRRVCPWARLSTTLGRAREGGPRRARYLHAGVSGPIEGGECHPRPRH